LPEGGVDLAGYLLRRVAGFDEKISLLSG